MANSWRQRNAAAEAFFVAAAALSLDLLTKAWAEGALSRGEPLSVVGEMVRLTLGYNTGVAFGMLQGAGAWLILITGAIIAGLIGWLAVGAARRDWTRSAAWPLGLILGGAIANFLDRWPDGRVIDFLDVGLGATRWPAFNAADSFIVVGVAALLLATTLGGEDAPASDAESRGGSTPTGRSFGRKS